LYEDEVEQIAEKVREHFEVLGETNKIQEVKSKEDYLGYQALHLDLKLNQQRLDLVEYKLCKDFQFELQIRTAIQDAWSTLDHKMKYKKTLPLNIKRRINILSALFEVADREFLEIKKEIELLSRKAEDAIREHVPEEFSQRVVAQINPVAAPEVVKLFQIKFPSYRFFPDKVENLLTEILRCSPNLSLAEFQNYFDRGFQKTEDYRAYLNKNKKPHLTPLTMVRHILYLAEKEKFPTLLFEYQKVNFDRWIAENNLS
jgi:putative GTP pyrophosphokinase